MPPKSRQQRIQDQLGQLLQFAQDHILKEEAVLDEVLKMDGRTMQRETRAFAEDLLFQTASGAIELLLRDRVRTAVFATTAMGFLPMIALTARDSTGFEEEGATLPYFDAATWLLAVLPS
ncbi:MAG TPA: hypothetical protein VGM54_25335 [Chthoniobacter sp.]|jgi:hypothetical protein